LGDDDDWFVGDWSGPVERLLKSIVPLASTGDVESTSDDKMSELDETRMDGVPTAVLTKDVSDECGDDEDEDEGEGCNDGFDVVPSRIGSKDGNISAMLPRVGMDDEIVSDMCDSTEADDADDGDEVIDVEVEAASDSAC